MAPFNSFQQDTKLKLFVGGLDKNTTQETLSQYFAGYGEPKVNLVTNKDTGQSKGFAFLTFNSADQLDQTQASRPHKIDGRALTTSRVLPKDDQGLADNTQVKKLFVARIRGPIEEENIKEIFKDYGNILSVAIPIDKETQRQKGFVFVEFDDCDSVDKAICYRDEIQVNGSAVDIKKGIDKSQQSGGRGGGRGGRGGPGGGGRGRGRGGGYGGGDDVNGFQSSFSNGYGAPRGRGRGGGMRGGRGGAGGMSGYSAGNGYEAAAGYGYEAAQSATGYGYDASQTAAGYGYDATQAAGGYGYEAADTTAGYGGYDASQAAGGYGYDDGSAAAAGNGYAAPVAPRGGRGGFRGGAGASRGAPRGRGGFGGDRGGSRGRGGPGGMRGRGRGGARPQPY